MTGSPEPRSPEADELRRRARSLRRFRSRIDDVRLEQCRMRSGTDTWTGPVAQRCSDDLTLAQRRLGDAADALAVAAWKLERQADLLEMTPAASPVGVHR